MVTNKNIIHWDWPLISIEWIPEILKSFDHLYEPSWAALFNLLTGELNNQRFGNRTFIHLKNYLLEFSLVEESGKYLILKVKPDKSSLKKYLIDFVCSSSESWHILFQSLSTQKQRLVFH